MNQDWVSIPNDTSWEIELRIERSRRMKISFRIETRFRFMYQQSYFSGDFGTYIHLNTWIELPILQTIFYFGHNERRFHSEFHSRVKFRSKFTWFRIDTSFRIECSIRNEKWNELDLEWVATQSRFMQTNIIQSPMISTETEWVRSGLKLKGSLHESGLSFNPERHFKLNSCLHGRLSWGLKDHGD